MYDTYRSKQKILAIGEGDFSYTACLAKEIGNASNVTATSLQTHDKVVAMYANAARNIAYLKEMRCNLLHGVDAFTMSKHPRLQLQLFDIVLFNFPHANLRYREHHASQIKLHQNLVLGFFKNACKMLAKNGEVHVTHKTAHPFDRWNIEKLARQAGLYLIEQVRFRKRDYPSYNNKKGEGHGSRCDKSFPIGECSIYKFGKL